MRIAAAILVFVLAAVSGAPAANEQCVCPRIVSREEWSARPPKAVLEMANPVSTVVVHHTYQPGNCATTADCEQAMRSMQVFHQDDRGWDDIGYSFAVGGDGRVYKGRGWNRVGAHAPPYNFDSIGITLIGDWSDVAPPKAMLDATQWLIKCGVDTGRILPDYQLIGHRQARSTACPGDALFGVVRTWDRWTQSPAPARHSSAGDRGLPAEYLSSDYVAASAPPAPPAPAAGTYDPATPVATRDAVEVHQLSKRSLWDRLVHIWQHEAIRQSMDENDNLAPESS